MIGITGTRHFCSDGHISKFGWSCAIFWTGGTPQASFVASNMYEQLGRPNRENLLEANSMPRNIECLNALNAFTKTHNSDSFTTGTMTDALHNGLN